MQHELERRVAELQALSQERNTLVDDNHAMKERLAASEAAVSQSENALKADRSRLREELQKRTAKVRLLEAEKQQLLMEGSEAHEKMAVAQRDAAALRVDLGAFNDQLREQMHQNDVLKVRLVWPAWTTRAAPTSRRANHFPTSPRPALLAGGRCATRSCWTS